MHIHYKNGDFVTTDNLHISPFDLGFTRGYGVHDFIVTYNNKPFKALEHIVRLLQSATIFGIQHTYTQDDLMKIVFETFEKNEKNCEKTMRIYLTGGESTGMRQSGKATLLCVVADRNRYDEHVYQQGIHVVAKQYERPFQNVKHNFYVQGVLELTDHSTIDEIIYYNEAQVFEGAGTNIFAVINNMLVTPKSNIVNGVTRNTVLDIVKLDIPVLEKDFTFKELLSASEVFVTGSNSEVRGVVTVNGVMVGSGVVGTITKECLRQYREYVQSVS